MAFVKPLNLIYRDLAVGFDVQKPGLVLTMLSNGHVRAVDVNGADDANVGMGGVDGPEPTFGVAYMTTADPLFAGPAGSPNAVTGHTVAYLTGVEIAVVREGIVRVPYYLGVGQNIQIGDLVSTLNQNALWDGHVRNHAPTALPNVWNDDTVDAILEEANAIVGIALEAVTGAAAAGYVNVLLQIQEIQYRHT